MEKFNWTTLNYNNSAVHLLIMVLLTTVVFALPAGLWTAAPLNEAQFFMSLKEAHTLPLTYLHGILCADAASLRSLRLISALAAFMIMLCAYFSAKRLCNLNTAFLSTMILLTMPLFERLTVMALPDMCRAALLALPVVLWFTAPGPLSLRRWLLIWLCAVTAALCGGLSTLYSILIFLAGNFLLITNKKQQFTGLNLLVPLVLFIGALVLLTFFPPTFITAPWFTQSSLSVSVGGAARLADVTPWIHLPWLLLQNMSVWLLACVIIILWLLTRVLRRRRPMGMPCQAPLGVWFIAALLPALLTNYEGAGRFLGVLPPVAVWIACFLDRYARYKVTLPKACFNLKVNAQILKSLLACWGILLCALGLYLLFNLEQAWQRGIYLETPDLVMLMGLGVVLILLALRSLWIKCRAYALWGFLVVVLLSFTFIQNAVFKPAIDLLHTPRYFDQNLVNLFPEIRWQGVIVGVNRASRPEIIRARYFLYADYPVLIQPVSADSLLLSRREALPPRLLVDDDVLAALGQAPFKAGYTPVYWEKVDGVLLTMLELVDVPTETASTKPVTLSTNAAGTALRAPGFCLAGGYLIPYENHHNAAAAHTQIERFPTRQLQLFRINTGEGLRNAYTFHWLITAGEFYREPHTGLELYNQTTYINKRRPYGYRFQRWALNTLREVLKPDFIVFSGLNPRYARTQRVLNKLLENDRLKQAAITAPMLEITVENLNGHTFLCFRRQDGTTLSLELRAAF